jgi:hypothetical protein
MKFMRLRRNLTSPDGAADPPKRNGGKGIRTPDIQLAKLALYQLSYAPVFED